MDQDHRIELEPDLRDALERLAKAEGRSLADLVNRAASRYLAGVDPNAYWDLRQARARPDAWTEALERAPDVAPQPGDELPEDYGRSAAE